MFSVRTTSLKIVTISHCWQSLLPTGKHKVTAYRILSVLRRSSTSRTTSSNSSLWQCIKRANEAIRFPNRNNAAAAAATTTVHAAVPIVLWQTPRTACATFASTHLFQQQQQQQRQHQLPTQSLRYLSTTGTPSPNNQKHIEIDIPLLNQFFASINLPTLLVLEDGSVATNPAQLREHFHKELNTHTEDRYTNRRVDERIADAITDILAVIDDQIKQQQQKHGSSAVDPVLLFNRAYLMQFMLDEHEMALANVDALIAQFPNEPELKLFRGFALLSLNRFEQARKCLDELLQMRPNHLIAATARATSLAAHNNKPEKIQEALESLDRAFMLSANKQPPPGFNSLVMYHMIRASLLHRLRRFEEALETTDDCAKVIESASQDQREAQATMIIELHLLRARTLIELGRPQDALKELDTVLLGIVRQVAHSEEAVQQLFATMTAIIEHQLRAAATTSTTATAKETATTSSSSSSSRESAAAAAATTPSMTPSSSSAAASALAREATKLPLALTEKQIELLIRAYSHPLYPDLLVLRGRALRKLGHHAEAVATFTMAHSLDPHHRLDALVEREACLHEMPVMRVRFVTVFSLCVAATALCWFIVNHFS